MHDWKSGSSGKSSSALAAAALALLGGLNACAPAPRPAAGPAVVPPVAPQGEAVPAGPAYRIDAARSELRILVYRSGALARLGHNHVIESHELKGEVHLTNAGVLDRAAFSLAVPVGGFIVDASASRREEGADFASEPSSADIEGTRHNLLGPGVLDAAAFPTLGVDGTTSVTAAGATAHAHLTVRGRASTLEVPVTVAHGPHELTIRGGFGVAQSSLGMTPFSVGLGALSVRDQLEVRFTIVAVEGS